MSQQVWATINPETTSGTMLAALLTDFKDAILSGFAGTSRPSQLQAGGMWIDTTNQSAPRYVWAFKIWTGTVDIEVFRLNVNNGYGGALTCDGLFEIKQISADTAGAIQELIKQRILLNGQVASGDTVAEIQFVGRTATSTDPVVAYVKWVGTDDQTSTASGGTLSFYSTPDASSTVAECLRLIDGQVENVLPLKLNSHRLVTQDIATSATIAQLSAAKYGVVFTGSTATEVQGINASHDSRELILHNRSSAIVTLKHQSASASAVDRMKLTGSGDLTIEPDGTVIMFYNSTDLRWKIKAVQRYSATKTIKTFKYLLNDFTVPTGVTQVLVTTYKKRHVGVPNKLLDLYGNLYVWGSNTNGQLGLGDVVPRSSPVAVLGGFQFAKTADVEAQTTATLAADSAGRAYAWGLNTSGQLGLGDLVPRSSPVAVLGGLKFAYLFASTRSSFAITPDNVAYAWGECSPGTWGGSSLLEKRSSPVAVFGGIKFNSFGFGGSVTNYFSYGLDITGAAYVWSSVGGASKGGVGDGTVSIASSSPMLVLGGLIFKKLVCAQDTAAFHMLGLTKDGAAYGWGANTSGQLGVGDVTARSSPVAVLGGLTFTDLYTGDVGTNGSAVYGMIEDGTLYAWGGNNSGQLGVGDTTNRSSPVQVLGGLKFKDVFTTTSSVFALTKDGTLYAWGSNTNGQLGLSDNAARSSPVAVLGGLKFETVFIGTGASIMGITPEGFAYMWGGVNTSGELGDGTVTARSSPLIVLGGLAHDTRNTKDVISVTVTPGDVIRIFMPEGRPARFGNVPLGIGLNKITVEYDTRGT